VTDIGTRVGVWRPAHRRRGIGHRGLHTDLVV